MPIKVLISDDNDTVRASLKRFLRGMQNIDVVGEARDGEEAVHFAVQHRPNVV